MPLYTCLVIHLTVSKINNNTNDKVTEQTVNAECTTETVLIENLQSQQETKNTHISCT